MSESEKNGTTPLTYWDYIKLDELLSLAQPLTKAHDELQFIIVHQAFELWFRLAIYELRGALDALNNGNLKQGVALLKRVATILRTSLHGFDPLLTMTQSGYAEFRDALKPASGFQSSQFRVMEILLGIERISAEEEAADAPDSNSREKFYWENAVQAGVTFDHFVDKYYGDLTDLYRRYQQNNLRRTMLRITEEAVQRQGVEAYRHVLAHRDEYPELTALAEVGRDLQQSMLEFRLSHHRVTVFSIGEHAAGTSDSHQAEHPSCAAYLADVARERSTIFPELEAAFTE